MLTVSYEFYQDTFHGTLSEEAFEQSAVFATAYVDELTMGNVPDDPDESTALRVRLAVCAVADLHAVQETRTGIAAESNDGISVTYASGTGSDSAGAQLYNAAAVYLAQTGLMYRGVR